MSAHATQIREHMEIVGSDGAHVGTVDKVEGDRIKLTKKDSGGAGLGGGHQDHHHYVPLGLVAAVGEQVRLSANGAVAVMFEEEQGGQQIEDDTVADRPGSHDESAPMTGSYAESAPMTGSAPQETNVSVTSIIDETGRAGS